MRRSPSNTEHPARSLMYVQPGLKLRPFFRRNLQLALEQCFRVRNRIDSGELQNQQAFVRPQIFDLQLAPRAIQRQREQPHAFHEPARHIAVHFRADFAESALAS